MAKYNFDACLKVTLGYEGGFVDDPRDPGGRTNHGVTQTTFNLYLARKLKPRRDVKTITQAELEDIYRHEFWDRIGGDTLPAGLDLAVFDYAVNSGVGRALPALQAVKGKSTAEAIKVVCRARLTFLQRLRTWATFGRGWARRDTDVQARALKMVTLVQPLPSPKPALSADISSAVSDLALTTKFAPKAS